MSGRKLRAALAQLIVLGLVALAALWFATNAADNLARRNIASGFGFLSDPAGFAVPMSLIGYAEGSSYGRVIMVGVVNTLAVSVIAIVVATVLGFAIGIARLSRNWLISQLAAAYIEIVRNIPLLLQIFVWYFAVLRALPPPRQSLSAAGIAFLNNRGFYLPAPLPGEGAELAVLAVIIGMIAWVVTARRARRRRLETGGSFPAWPIGLAGLVLLVGGVAIATEIIAGWSVPALRGFNFSGGMVIIPEFVALAVALSIYTAAFIAEVVRAGIQAVRRGQIEAASALGLSRGQTLRFVILPQALRVIVPPLTNQYLNLTKNSSLGAAIAFPELVSIAGATVVSQTGQAIEVIAIVMGFYLAVSLTISATMNFYNQRIALKGR